MPNTLVTPSWLVKELELELTQATQTCATMVNLGFDTIGNLQVVAPEHPIVEMSPKTIVALGAASIVASPRKLSRRGFFAFGLKR